MRVILCGLPRVGKSTVGQRLAQELGWYFIDLDDRLEELYQQEVGVRKTCHKIYQAEGERVFRKWEEKALSTIEEENSLVSLGGGTVEHPTNRERLRKLGYVIFLHGNEEVLWKRMEFSVPAFLDPKDPKSSFLKLAKRREKQYLNICHKVVDVGELTIEEIVRKLWLVITLESCFE